jgi:hypothetical protein
MASRDDGISLLASLVNFGAILSFIVLHLAVIVRWLRYGRPGSAVRNVVVPLVGMAILIGIVVHANILAQRVGIAWLAAGVLILLALIASGRRPHLAGLDADAGSGDHDGATADRRA